MAASSRTALLPTWLSRPLWPKPGADPFKVPGAGAAIRSTMWSMSAWQGLPGTSRKTTPSGSWPAVCTPVSGT
jgi:hypothetical protein